MASPVVQECRGLLLEEGTWNVVAMPFTKFFNFGEKLAPTIDWSTAVLLREPNSRVCRPVATRIR